MPSRVARRCTCRTAVRAGPGGDTNGEMHAAHTDTPFRCCCPNRVFSPPEASRRLESAAEYRQLMHYSAKIKKRIAADDGL